MVWNVPDLPEPSGPGVEASREAWKLPDASSNFQEAAGPCQRGSELAPSCHTCCQAGARSAPGQQRSAPHQRQVAANSESKLRRWNLGFHTGRAAAPNILPLFAYRRSPCDSSSYTPSALGVVVLSCRASTHHSCFTRGSGLVSTSAAISSVGQYTSTTRWLLT